MLISRQVGTVNSLVTVFLPDRTVSTGAGLANVVASTVRLTWLRDDMAAVSSWTLTTGTLGTWASSTMTQLGSTSTLGLYQFSLPNALFVSGSLANVHIMSSTALFAEVPVAIELTKTDNQTYLSSQTVGFVRNNVSVSTVTIPVGVSTGSIGVSSISIPVSVSSVTAGVNVTSIQGSAAVTSAAGVLGPLAVSSVTTPVTVSSVTAAVNVSSIYGSAAVTSAAGVWGPLAVSSVTDKGSYGVSAISIPVSVSAGTVRVSAATIPFGVSSLSAAALGNFFDTGALFFSTAVVSSVVFEIATNATATVGEVGVSAISIPVSVSSVLDKAGYGVSAISIPVSVSSGTVRVSAVTIPVGVSTGSIEISSMTAAAAAIAADKLLGRNVSSGGDGTRTVGQALYVLRNRVDVSTGIVYQTDDTTSSWAFAVSTTPGDPIYSITPI